MVADLAGNWGAQCFVTQVDGLSGEMRTQGIYDEVGIVADSFNTLWGHRDVNLKHSCEIVSFPAGWQTKSSPFVLACHLHSLEIEARQILATLI